MEIGGGKVAYEGTGSCSYAVWTFTRGDTQYTVGGLSACAPPDQQPGVRGTLEVTAGGKSLAHFSCY
ncbi:MAG: hypothetical protein WDO73_06200 [Ignavibacteriota bacterium]